MPAHTRPHQRTRREGNATVLVSWPHSQTWLCATGEKNEPHRLGLQLPLRDPTSVEAGDTPAPLSSRPPCHGEGFCSTVSGQQTFGEGLNRQVGFAPSGRAMGPLLLSINLPFQLDSAGSRHVPPAHSEFSRQLSRLSIHGQGNAKTVWIASECQSGSTEASVTGTRSLRRGQVCAQTSKQAASGCHRRY